MNRTYQLAFALITAVASSIGAEKAAIVRPASAAVGKPAPTDALWRDRNTRALNLYYGPGGKQHAPKGRFTFVKEEKDGTSPKFEVKDENGVRWKAKLGPEAQAETAATRLVWAAGYFADEDYYVPSLRVEGMSTLIRGSKFVSDDGVVHGVRLERVLKGQKKARTWRWRENAYSGTKEMNGLRVMMALVNNWDLKDVNNNVQVTDGEPRYAVTDLGATFGGKLNPVFRSKNKLPHYEKTKFIQKVTATEVDFHLSTRPFPLFAIAPPYYVYRTRLQRVVKDIPRAHAKWLGTILTRLSAEQIRDCFRAAGYSPTEVEGFSRVVESRIAELNRL